MDSLTQITLGAAVGEVVLGKKAGNRAMLWGAIAGTFPDLDIFANFVTDQVSALAYHRAFTHSILFSVVIPLGMGLLVHRLYGGKEGKWPKNEKVSLFAGWAFFFLAVLIGSSLMPLEINNIGSIALVVSLAMIAFPLVIYFREKRRKTPSVNKNPGWWLWTQLFFWAILTHPLLDACTTYGTQLFEPFSTIRIAWNVVSVADPLYTLPFLVCLILASRQIRGSKKRQRYNWAGIIISSAYLLLCTSFFWYANQRMEATLEKENITATRHVVGPTILNSLLWQGTAETPTSFYMGQYSLLDKAPFFKLKEVPKNHQLVKDHWDDRDVNILRWFSDGYFNVEQENDSTFRMNDLRYGQIDVPGKRPQHIFYFLLQEKAGQLQAVHVQQGPEDREASMSGLWERIMGQ
ncbi:metal-dependent hydrolase [Lewinella cohaerens]|uniref:metal-dependent hydrolase n=1 Tax=Lewinella cohaerens TaxID=70995 RepID=UPI0003734B32|nr:metal-dependent hydrolase [Lewinella cohaerens]